MGSSPPFPAATPDRADAATQAADAKWAALHDAAGVVAVLAGFADEPPSSEIRDFPTAIRRAMPWRRELAHSGIDDLAAIMEPGIAALLAVHARGSDTRAPALALWREFRAARDALLTLAVLEHA